MEELVRAKKKALMLLTDRDRTEKELREKLLRSGFSEEITDLAMEYVRGYGYLDDQRLAVHYLQSNPGHRSRRRLLYDLEQKGIDRSALDAALEEVGEAREHDLIRYLAEKKLRTLHCDPSSRYQKTAAYLGRKGFRGEDIHAVLEDLRQEGAFSSP